MHDAYQETIESQIETWSYLSPVDITGGLEINGNTATVTANQAGRFRRQLHRHSGHALHLRG
ncbi:MAG: hypothetical protein R3E12_07095 [Candidatus Eisenbacteria bacterium]